MKKQTNTITALPFNMEEMAPADIRQSLDNIERKLDREIVAKQSTIARQEAVIQHLNALMEEKNTLILQMNEKLAECSRNNEGNRQLINKLLNDIDRLHQDIEWYKRTYETRSLLGTIKEKIFRRR
jgi:hypothetical protein